MRQLKALCVVLGTLLACSQQGPDSGGAMDLASVSNPGGNADLGSQDGFMGGIDGKTGPEAPSRVVGYFVQWGVYARNYHVKNIDTSGSAKVLTHLNYAFSNPTGGRCVLGDSYADIDKAYTAAESVDGVADTWDAGALRGSFNQLRKLKAKYPKLKVLISIGGWSWSDSFSTAALQQNRVAFVDSCVSLYLKDKRWAGLFDGLDIDWEYPAACGNTCNHRPEDTQNFTALLAEFRKQMDAVKPGLLLTIAAPADPQKTAKIEVSKIHPYLDFINIMTYDMHGAWEKQTNFHSPLYNSPKNPARTLRYSSHEAVEAWTTPGTPNNKVLLGVPFYGRGWSQVPGTDNGLWQTAGGAASATYEAGIEDYKVLKKLTAPGFTHPDTKAYWTYAGGTFWSYDTPSVLAQKLLYVNENRLGGIMFWELSGDTADGELIRVFK